MARSRLAAAPMRVNMLNVRLEWTKPQLEVGGLLLGAVFMAFSLTPSLLPRPSLVQGMLSGLSFAAG